jgi:hypothetical protein
MVNVYLRSNIINITQGIKIKYKKIYLIYIKNIPRDEQC